MAAAGRGRGRTFTLMETKQLLQLVREHLPSGGNQWGTVMARFNQLTTNDRQRDAEALKTRFNKCRSTPFNKTTNYITAEIIQDAIEIQELIDGSNQVLEAPARQNLLSNEDEIMSMLTIVNAVLPVGEIGWNLVETRYNLDRQPEDHRTAALIKGRYTELRNNRKPTGDPTLPENCRFAKEIAGKIALRSSEGVEDEDSDAYSVDEQFEDSNSDHGDNGGSTIVMIMLEIPRTLNLACSKMKRMMELNIKNNHLPMVRVKQELMNPNNRRLKEPKRYDTAPSAFRQVHVPEAAPPAAIARSVLPVQQAAAEGLRDLDAAHPALPPAQQAVATALAVSTESRKRSPSSTSSASATVTKKTKSSTFSINSRLGSQGVTPNDTITPEAAGYKSNQSQKRSRLDTTLKALTTSNTSFNDLVADHTKTQINQNIVMREERELERQDRLRREDERVEREERRERELKEMQLRREELEDIRLQRQMEIEERRFEREMEYRRYVAEMDARRLEIEARERRREAEERKEESRRSDERNIMLLAAFFKGGGPSQELNKGAAA
ncbi:hypothetical protein HDU97_003444 [Phlyctochytrium planicorne]|nr:hypothetical protein HDU97_003444 [Phlyctochytrium planicorne]